eukprot:UN24957
MRNHLHGSLWFYTNECHGHTSHRPFSHFSGRVQGRRSSRMCLYVSPQSV